MGWLVDETGLERCRANFTPLTPLSHLRRAARVFPDREALVYGNIRHSYREYHQRVTQLAAGLSQRGVTRSDVVSTLLPNVPSAAETHFGVPASGAILNAINIRLDRSTVAYILDHARPKIFIVDSQFIQLAEDALGSMRCPQPEIIEVDDPVAGVALSGRYNDYESLIRDAKLPFAWQLPEDEWESLALNYTSGTTGRPKGVVYHHRGAYLMTMGTVISWRLTLFPRYLTIVPLFHCNGWNHIWMVPVLGGTVVCCRHVSAKEIYAAIANEGVTHFGGAPIVLNMIINAKPEERRHFAHRVEIFTAGAPPASATLAKIEELSFNVTHVYGLTETFGHATECVWQTGSWDELDATEVASAKARQGVPLPTLEEATVIDTNTIREVTPDGQTLGEVVMRGNLVMKGYFRNPEATCEAFRDGYFHTGDIAALHEDSYIQITDRSKDIIISGGENISSVEVEGVLMHHPAVSLCAVVARPDDKWGETPFAFVELKEGVACGEAELIEHCRKTLAGFKIPKGVAFTELPKTSTGKIQKFTLRDRVKDL